MQTQFQNITALCIIHDAFPGAIDWNYLVINQETQLVHVDRQNKRQVHAFVPFPLKKGRKITFSEISSNDLYNPHNLSLSHPRSRRFVERFS